MMARIGWHALCGVALMCCSCAPVTVRQTTWPLPYYTRGLRPDGFPMKGAAERFEGQRDFHVIRLENRYLRVDVLPEVGGAVGRAVYKPTGDDLFFYQGRAKNWIPFWEAGVKGCFPWHEHGIRMDQPASYRVIREPDGGATLAMWMEFSRFDESTNLRQWGRFGSMLFSQIVRLRPDDATFSVTYRMVNPTPYRQGRRLWNDAFFPRNHTAAGAVQADAMPHGFAGLWYPDVDVNRLRLSDPKLSPGAKQYFGVGGDYEPKQKGSAHANFVELWGGTDSVFEGVENWIGPGESFAFTHRFALVRGIGKVSFASENAAIHALEFVTFRPRRDVSVGIDGRTVASGLACGPTSPARVPLKFSTGRLQIVAGDQVLIDQIFPLPMPVDPAEQDRIRDANFGATAECVERQGDARCRGRSYNDALGRYPPESTRRGRILYRSGQLDSAIATLGAATKASPADAEAWHLLGAALLDKGDMAAADAALAQARAYAPSAYYRAIRAVARGDLQGAIAELRALAAAIPAHYEARLLLAYLSRDAALAENLSNEDPADPRAQYVLETVTGRPAALTQMLQEPGASKRLAEFKSQANGQFVPPPRMRTTPSRPPATMRAK